MWKKPSPEMSNAVRRAALNAVLHEGEGRDAFLGVQNVLEILLVIRNGAEGVQTDLLEPVLANLEAIAQEPSTSEVTFL